MIFSFIIFQYQTKGQIPVTLISCLTLLYQGIWFPLTQKIVLDLLLGKLVFQAWRVLIMSLLLIYFKLHVIFGFQFDIAFELEDLKRFTLDNQSDAHTIIFKHHPIVLINALEVLGYKVVSSFNHGPESCVWTMRKDFPDPEPSDEEESVMFQNSNVISFLLLCYSWFQ